jgi:hypothetical protein
MHSNQCGQIAGGAGQSPGGIVQSTWRLLFKFYGGAGKVLGGLYPASGNLPRLAPGMRKR